MFPIYLVPQACHLFEMYMLRCPAAYKHELEVSGIDPILFPDTFIQYELLTECEHADVLKQVKDNNGVVGIEEIKMWISENINECKQGWPYEYKGNRIITAQIELTSLGKHCLLHYFISTPEQRKIEINNHGLDPLMFPNEFFRSEVTIEPWHKNIVDMITRNNGQVDERIIKAWIIEEGKEEC
jgi:hypothetical protein